MRKIYERYFESIINYNVALLKVQLSSSHVGYEYKNILAAIGIKLLLEANQHNNLMTNPIQKQVNEGFKDKEELILAKLTYAIQFTKNKSLEEIKATTELFEQETTELNIYETNPKYDSKIVKLKIVKENGIVTTSLVDENNNTVFETAAEENMEIDKLVWIEMASSFAKMNGWDVITEGEFMEDLDKYDFLPKN